MPFGIMMKIEPGLYKSVPARYLISIGAVVAAFLVRQALLKLIGVMPAYAAFYPAVTIVALFAGAWPAALAAAIAAGLSAYWILKPTGSFYISSLPDVIGLAIFSFTCMLICVMAGLFHRSRQKETDFAVERAVQAEKKKEMEALRQSEERFRKIFENSHHGIVMVAPTFLFEKANPAFCRMMGYSEDELRSMTFADITHPDHLEQDTEYVTKVARGEMPFYQTEKLYISKSGEELFGDVIVSTVRDGCGELQYFVSMVRDITKRKRAEAALHASRAQLSDALEMAHLGHWEYDVAGDLFTFNDQFYKIFRTTAEQVGGYTMRSAEYANRFVHPDDRHLVGEEIKKSAEAAGPGFSRQFEHQIRYADGTFGHVSVRVFVVKDSHGRVVKHYGVNQDITERRQVEEYQRELEERLQRAEKMEALGTLAGGVAHDLNNVLGVVVGYSEMVLDEVDESSPLRGEVMKIMQGGQRSAAIVQDLLTLARRGVQTSQVFNLNLAVTECRKTPEFEKILSFNPNVRIKTSLEADLLNTAGSPVHIAKTIINLVANAVEAMPDGGVLTIATGNRSLDKPIHGYDALHEGDYAVLSIADTGEGISDDDLKRIFEPFYTKKVMGRSGTGLGLAVVWGTVKDHNGYIDVQSEVGKGTTFELYFPATREEMAEAKPAAPLSDYIGNEESILVIDDVKEQRELAAAMLGKLNYRVKTVASGEDAVEYLKENKADLIVLDMIMDPGMDGLDTYKAILELHPGQKAVIVSGFSETERVKEAGRLGASEYVRKPYVIGRLGLAVRKELTRK